MSSEAPIAAASTELVGELGDLLGITRPAARRVACNLEARGYAVTAPDTDDARKLNVVLSEAGRAYGSAIAEVITSLNRELLRRAAPGQLQAADAVLRAAIDDDASRARAQTMLVRDK